MYYTSVHGSVVDQVLSLTGDVNTSGFKLRYLDVDLHATNSQTGTKIRGRHIHEN